MLWNINEIGCIVCDGLYKINCKQKINDEKSSYEAWPNFRYFTYWSYILDEKNINYVKLKKKQIYRAYK